MSKTPRKNYCVLCNGKFVCTATTDGEQRTCTGEPLMEGSGGFCEYAEWILERNVYWPQCNDETCRESTEKGGNDD